MGIKLKSRPTKKNQPYFRHPRDHIELVKQKYLKIVHFEKVMFGQFLKGPIRKMYLVVMVEEKGGVQKGQEKYQLRLKM